MGLGLILNPRSCKLGPVDWQNWIGGFTVLISRIWSDVV